MLENKAHIKTYRLGIVAPRTFNDITILHELLANKLASISHINTNNVISGGELIQTYAKTVGIPFSVYPISPTVGGALISNFQIIQNSDFIYILDDGESENAKNVVKECDKRVKNYKVVSYVALPIKQAELNKIKTLIQNKLKDLNEQNFKEVDISFLEKILKITE